jgi:hypothetical protein
MRFKMPVRTAAVRMAGGGCLTDNTSHQLSFRMADAAHGILTRRSRQYIGKFFIGMLPQNTACQSAHGMFKVCSNIGMNSDGNDENQPELQRKMAA